MHCPECDKLGMVSVFWSGSSEPGQPRTRIYYDELGQEHAHTPGKKQPFWCSNGHKFICIWEETCSINSLKWSNKYTDGESDTDAGPWCDDIAAERLETVEPPDEVVAEVGRWLTKS